MQLGIVTDPPIIQIYENYEIGADTTDRHSRDVHYIQQYISFPYPDFALKGV